uniref:Uncharacterized protein n=1 Tax=Anguilla anguilla TaxID=7936 RepID=A0A0E9U204_ANGAN
MASWLVVGNSQLLGMISKWLVGPETGFGGTL